MSLKHMHKHTVIHMYVCTYVCMYIHLYRYLYDLHHEPRHILQPHASQAVSDGILQRIIVWLGQHHPRKQVTDDALKEREVLQSKREERA